MGQMFDLLLEILEVIFTRISNFDLYKISYMILEHLCYYVNAVFLQKH